MAKRIGELGPVTTALKDYEDAKNVKHPRSLTTYTMNT